MKLDYKKLVTIFSLTVLVITIIMIGASYAWYVANNKTKIVIESLGEEAMKISFEETDIISLDNAVPINDSISDLGASFNNFNINLGKMNINTSLSIKIIDIAIANELKISNFKYQLLKDSVVMATGDFSSIGSDVEKIIYTQNILSGTENTTNSWTLKIWLSDDENNQNNLMNKSFSGKIQASIYVGGNS